MRKWLWGIFAIGLLVCSAISIVRGNNQIATLFGILGGCLIAIHTYINEEEKGNGNKKIPEPSAQTPEEIRARAEEQAANAFVLATTNKPLP